MKSLKEDFQELLNLLLDIKSTILKFKEYKGNTYYKEKFESEIKELNRIYKFLNAKIPEESNSSIRSKFKKIQGDIETILEHKNLEIVLEVIDYIETFWPEIEIILGKVSEEVVERIYDKGNRFDFHLDIKSILDKSKQNLFIIDSWVNESLLEIYLKNLPKNINIRILSGDKPKGELIKIGNMFKTQYGSILEIRESPYIHDRAIFCDSNEGWVMGQSIKDGAKNKPTYLIKLKKFKQLKDIYEKIWYTSKKIV